MASRDDLISFANDYLDVGSYPDYAPVGLQVAGAKEVSKVVCGVSASLDLFQQAAAIGAQLVLVHHGLFWDRDSRVIGPLMRARLEQLFVADLTLVAYHLALDAHPEVGNNALLCRRLGFEPKHRFAEVGFGGELSSPSSIDELAARIGQELGREPLVFPYGPDGIRRVAVCSGAAADDLGDAAAAGYDCFVTGEANEPAKHAAIELGTHFIAAGHYATETLGVQALAARLAAEFSIEWEFVDLPNPV